MRYALLARCRPPDGRRALRVVPRHVRHRRRARGRPRPRGGPDPRILTRTSERVRRRACRVSRNSAVSSVGTSAIPSRGGHRSANRRRTHPTCCFVVLDDVGFAQIGCYGSDIATPNIDRLAAGGVRFSNFHTSALCSPTRSCLLTGRNHHSNGMGRVADLASGYPGYSGDIPRANGFLSEILRDAGVRDLRGGQVAPHARRRDPHGGRSQLVAARPRVRPLVRVPRRRDAPVRAHALLRQPLGPTAAHDRRGLPPQRRPRRPRASSSCPISATSISEQRFFLYFATGACHSPHQAPPEWIARYRGQFDDGWDRWRERDARPPARRRHHPAGNRAVTTTRVGPRVGRPARARPEGRGAVHGVLRRVPLVHRRPDRRACSTSSSSPAISTTP